MYPFLGTWERSVGFEISNEMTVSYVTYLTIGALGRFIVDIYDLAWPWSTSSGFEVAWARFSNRGGVKSCTFVLRELVFQVKLVLRLFRDCDSVIVRWSKFVRFISVLLSSCLETKCVWSWVCKYSLVTKIPIKRSFKKTRGGRFRSICIAF